ncbi:MAG: hypothetical protein QOF41_812 [Methylobacteriaceae bacterium]|nr:hypothetical protein [Methylobacteriaceae bacterium]
MPATLIPTDLTDAGKRGPFRYSPEFQECGLHLEAASLESLKIGADGTLTALQGGREVKGTLNREIYRGVEVLKLTIQQFCAGDARCGNLTVRVSLRDRYTLSQRGTFCSPFGQAPTWLEVVFEPGRLAWLKAWMKTHSEDFDPDFSVPDKLDKFKNYRAVGVKPGTEIKAQASLREEPWIIEVSRRQIPLGPNDTLLDFAPNTIITDSATQSSIQKLITTQLPEIFPNISFQRDAVHASGPGFQYVLEMNAPVTHILPGEAVYKDHWLKAKINLIVYAVVVGGKQFDRVQIQAPDGYLPKWPDEQNVPPPASLTRGAHLDETSSNPLLNFRILQKVKGAIATSLQGKWQGTLLAE